MYENKLRKILTEITGEKDIKIEVPTNYKFGDYSSNVAMVLAKKRKINPKDLAEEIKTKLLSSQIVSKLFDKIEIAGPGFINFYLKKDVLIDNLIHIDMEYGKGNLGKDKTAIVEYSSPNIAKPFTVGHLRSTIIGDAIANLFEFSGWKVFRDNHLGDWGTQFGKQIYAIKNWGNKEEGERYSVKELVDLYVRFHKEAEKNPEIEDYAREWFKKLEDGDKEAREIWQKCVDWSWVEFERIYKLLGIKFSKEFSKGKGLGESFFESRMPAVILELKKNKMLKVGEKGAKLVFFENEKYPPAMIVKKDGATLYHTRDLATDKYRLEKYNPDLILNEVGSEQALYFRQLFEMEKMLGWYKEGQRVHVGHGLIRFKEGKMSTRKGNVIWMEDILKEAITKARELGSNEEKLARQVAIGALKYNDLKRDPKTEIVFGWKEILNMEGNSGPYLQYTTARTNSVLAKIQNPSSETLSKLKIKNLKLKINNEELIILCCLAHFPEVIQEASQNYAPNLVCNYLYDLASKFNTFYNRHKIIGGENEELRIILTQKTGAVLKTGLNLLGIQSPEKM